MAEVLEAMVPGCSGLGFQTEIVCGIVVLRLLRHKQLPSDGPSSTWYMDVDLIDWLDPKKVHLEQSARLREILRCQRVAREQHVGCTSYRSGSTENGGAIGFSAGQAPPETCHEQNLSCSYLQAI